MPTREASLVAMDVREFKTFRELIHQQDRYLAARW